MNKHWRRIVGFTFGLALIAFFTGGIVWAWITLSAVGVLISGYLTNESRLDLRGLGPRANGRRQAARSRLAREFLRCTVHMVYLTAGAAALGFLPEGIIIFAIMYGNVVLVMNSMIDGSTRGALVEQRRESG